MKKEPTLEFVKKINEVDFVANLLVDLCKKNNEQYILLKGDIGSGKTTLVKEIGKILKEEEHVTSPSFNKMFVYNQFVHIDAYNLKGQNLNQFVDYFDNKLILIEWAELLNQKFDEGFEVEIQYIDSNTRKYIIKWKE